VERNTDRDPYLEALRGVMANKVRFLKIR